MLKEVNVCDVVCVCEKGFDVVFVDCLMLLDKVLKMMVEGLC